MIKKTSLAAAVTAALVTAGSYGASTEDRIEALEKELADLKSQVKTNEADIEEARPSKKGTKFQYGGYIQLDMIHSNYSEGKPSNDLIEDFFVPSLIPVEPINGVSDSYSSTNIHAKSSRFYFTTSTDTGAGNVSTRIELDFLLSAQGDERISNSWSSRLRHAFVKWEYKPGSSLLAGQSWSTFFNVGALPDLLDFVGPVGTVFMRQPQIRWTTGGFQLALENPATRLNDDGGGTRLDDAETMPDVIARYNGTAGGLNWSIAGMARQLGYEDRDTSNAIVDSDDKSYGYGLSFAGKWMFGKNDLRFMLNYGDALGRYLGLNSFNDGYIDTSGKIKKINQLGGFVAYQHYWTPKWRSTFSLSASKADNPDLGDYAQADSLAKSYRSAHANINWLPVPKLQLGFEAIYGHKELEDGRKGALTRGQFAVKYAF